MNTEFKHFKTINYRDSTGEPDRCFWYVAKNDRVMQFAFCFGHPDIDIKPYAIDLGRHSPEPMYDGEKPFSECCHILGGRCYYDGTSLGANDFAEEAGVYHEINDKLIFEMLEVKWERWFGCKEESIIQTLVKLSDDQEADHD